MYSITGNVPLVKKHKMYIKLSKSSFLAIFYRFTMLSDAKSAFP